MSRTYHVNDIYWAVQGEGVLSGTPMVILRLQGCPVACAFCDTKETWALSPAHRRDTIHAALGQNPSWCEAPVEEILAHVRLAAGEKTGWVLLTGGEPARQPLPPLVKALRDAGFKVALETSGTADGHIETEEHPGDRPDHITVSPKLDNPGHQKILGHAVASADELKFVVGCEDDLTRLDGFMLRYSLETTGAVVSLQPESCGAEATRLCLRACRERGWNLSLQTHKMIGAR